MCRRELRQMAVFILGGVFKQTQPGPGAWGCDVWRWVEHQPEAPGKKKKKVFSRCTSLWKHHDILD